MTAVSEDDVRYLKRQQRFLRMDVHPTLCSIVVSYSVEAAVLGDTGDYMTGERKEFDKVISLRNLRSDCNMLVVAESIMNKCHVIPSNQMGDVAQLIRYLQKRHKGDTVTNSKGATEVSGANDQKVGFGDGFMDETFEDGKLANGESANLDDLETYIEMLYEDEADRVKGTTYILQLCRVPGNLDELVENDTLLSALSRVLREDWKKNMQLAINIIYCFFCFSTFSKFHPIILKHKVGVQLLEALEYEVTRYKQWMKLLAEKKRKDILAVYPIEQLLLNSVY